MIKEQTQECECCHIVKPVSDFEQLFVEGCDENSYNFACKSCYR